MSTIRGLRKVELKLPIALHEEVKVIANNANMTQGAAVLKLIILGIESFKKQKAEAEKNEPADMAAGE